MTESCDVRGRIQWKEVVIGRRDGFKRGGHREQAREGIFTHKAFTLKSNNDLSKQSKSRYTGSFLIRPPVTIPTRHLGQISSIFTLQIHERESPVCLKQQNHKKQAFIDINLILKYVWHMSNNNAHK